MWMGFCYLSVSLSLCSISDLEAIVNIFRARNAYVLVTTVKFVGVFSSWCKWSPRSLWLLQSIH